MKTYPMTIDGKSVDTGRTLEIINPALGQPFAAVPVARPQDVDAAVAAARKAFPAWRATSAAERQAMLHALGAALEANMPELMDLITRETGKPLQGLNNVGAGMELGGSIAWTHVTADLPLEPEVIQDNEQARVEVHRKPLGVVASITPWNWPLMIAIWHIIPALRAGNTVVLKPSEYTPVATARFVELAQAVLPPGVLNVVIGGGDIGAALSQHPDINKIVFTGSTRTGKRIMENAAASLKRLTLELGGNDAGIVLPGADVQAIAPKLFGVAFHNNGQTCACLKRLYVHDSQYDAVCTELARLAKEVRVGDGLDPATELGPLQNRAQLDVVSTLAADAAANGGTILSGGKARAGQGYFFEPTIVAGLSNGARLVDEEQFGPILPVIRYSDVEQAIALANDNPNGLGGSVWSSDLALAAEVGKRLECGTVWINEHGAVQPDAPFGGVKQSGIGVEFGHHGLAEFTSIQTVKIMKN
ncbi:aldehyde dehydrogenase family protein [Duganella radicis]|uniref:aldehyde dehydrogenase (NAD(+)) n=1 Tax=Duganella radicis TaxID=551988 RepID=A0A6L6PAR8_9BURK|nr:aldehyde dehydrogenase family protein [Duganella radicis]MTV36024.1 aldehyde dehydrogenase family protein [Duganella radicis]